MFVLDCNNEVAASTLTESKQDSPVTQSMPAPYRVWYSIPFKVGNLPPKTQFLTVSMYNARYRGYLGITNRTDGRDWLIYEGYLYHPDYSYPIPASVKPLK